MYRLIMESQCSYKVSNVKTLYYLYMRIQSLTIDYGIKMFQFYIFSHNLCACVMDSSKFCYCIFLELYESFVIVYYIFGVI